MSTVSRSATTSIAFIALVLVGWLAVVTPAQASPTFEQEFVRLLNVERSQRGLPTLPVHTDLRAVARSHSDTMASRNLLHHNPSLSSSVTNWSRLTENVGRGPGVASIHRALMDSRGHRENILDQQVNQVGVGVTVRNGTVWVTQVFRRSTQPQPTTASVSGFSDVSASSPHDRDIAWLRSSGITAGCGSNRFCPRDPVTREQMASFLVRGFGLPSSTRISFRDVAGTHAIDVRSLAAAGITRGCNPPTNDRFCPRNAVTREQMATFMVRALDLPAVRGNRFRDVGGPHAADVNALAAAGITLGCNPPTNDRFCPSQQVTREQMASFLARALR